MTFSEFANILKPVIGGSANTAVFTKSLLETIICDKDSDLLDGLSKETFKSYFNGKTKITRTAKKIKPYIDVENFIPYLENFGDSTQQELIHAFSPYIDGLTIMNVYEKLAYFFNDIISEAAQDKRKSTSKDASKNTDSIGLPEEQPADESPYSSEDAALLHEFTSEFDEIMMTIIGEGYGAALLDMALPRKVKKLYESKWKEKANNFSDLTLKSHVFALLGDLNQIGDSFLSNTADSLFMGNTRKKIRNLYVKLHPDSYTATYPYDAFIDDWDDGEF